MDTNTRANKRTRPRPVQQVEALVTYINLGDIVYLKTDTAQYPRMVTAIIHNFNGVLYQLSSNTELSTHYGQEISKEKDILISTSYI